MPAGMLQLDDSGTGSGQCEARGESPWRRRHGSSRAQSPDNPHQFWRLVGILRWLWRQCQHTWEQVALLVDESLLGSHCACHEQSASNEKLAGMMTHSGLARRDCVASTQTSRLQPFRTYLLLGVRVPVGDAALVIQGRHAPGLEIDPRCLLKKFGRQSCGEYAPVVHKRIVNTQKFIFTQTKGNKSQPRGWGGALYVGPHARR